MKTLRHCLAASSLAVAGVACAVPQYTLTVVAPVGSAGYGINNAGVVVGYSGSQSAFVHSGGNYSTFRPPGSWSGSFTTINDSGSVIGDAAWPDTSTSAMIYDMATQTHAVYPAPANMSVRLLDINNAGHRVGALRQGSSLRAFIDTGSGMQLLTPDVESRALAINGSGIAVGDAIVDNVRQAVVFDSSGYTPVLASGEESVALAVNDGGWIGGTFSVGRRQSAFLRDPQGQVTTFMLQDHDMFVQDINNAGLAVGRTWVASSPDSFGYLFLEDGTAIDLNTRLVGAEDWLVADARAINESGQIVGTACSRSTGLCQAVRLDVSPVPEPRAWATLLLGLAALSTLGRRVSQGPKSGSE